MMNGYEYTGMDAILAGSFRAAIYCRLSKDDDLDGESASIANQRDMLESYCEKQGWEVVAVYQDDGYTGLNMERPDLKRMLKAIERRQINLVITKDLSRLGRNYLQTGTLIEDFFPRHGVRYIAMNDGIDTMRDNNDIAPFKNILNEMYSKDISKKVHSSYLLKAQQGQFTGCVAPFGYRKDPEDKNHLLVDEETAPIVRQIFLWALEGHGPNFIRRRLEEQKVPCPTWWNRERGFRNVRTKWEKKDPENGRYVGAMHDSFPHALELSKQGYNAFALIYRPGAQTACEDLARAITFIFDHAEELEVDTSRYSLWGGSAGARMAAWLGTYGPAAFSGDDLPRPGAVIMQYTGLSEYSPDDPPTFVCVGDSDGIAPWRVMQARLEAMSAQGIDTEFHCYPGLGHGFGLGTGTAAEGWLDLAVQFWERQM